MAIVKNFYQEVALAMGKAEIDDLVINKASDILKLVKAEQFNYEPLLAKYRLDGTAELYKKVLAGRRA